ncbi:MAG: hypothetical protein RLZZ306_1381 [Bacteroidota bacterium]|jgi:uncharacterized protein (TIGR02453 family)
MSNKQAILDFLKDLSQNNSKEWMDANRDRYVFAKDVWLAEVQQILMLLGKFNQSYFVQFKPKDCISRITNNRMFNPNLPVYKDFFTFSIMDKTDVFSPLHISVGAESSFVGCGYHNPEKQTLKNIRDAIDYDGKSLHDILEDKTFKDFFGGLSNFTEPLKTSPKGYDKDHPFVEYLRYKNYTISRNFTHEEFVSNNFLTLVEQAYELSTPFRDYLKKANSF